MLSDINSIKFKDYLDIKKTSNNGFSAKIKGKTSNYKGEKTELYILPIFDELFQYNTYEYLFNIVKEKNSNRKDISFEEFLEVMGILFKGELIEVYNNETDSRQVSVKGGLYGDSYEFHKNYLINKRIAIINFTYGIDIEPLINELNSTSLKEVKLINFCNEPSKINNIYSINLDKFVIENKHYSEIDTYFKNFTDSLDLVILYNSANNYELTRKINKRLIENNISFINCITNDFEISMGPLTVPHKTSCPECSSFLNSNESLSGGNVVGEDGSQVFKSYKVNRRAMSLISAGLLLDEIIKYLTIDALVVPPLAFNHKLVINGLDLHHRMEEIVLNPLCSSCGRHNENKIRKEN